MVYLVVVDGDDLGKFWIKDRRIWICCYDNSPKDVFDLR